MRGASKGDFKRCTKGRTRQRFVGSVDRLEVAAVTAASLALPPDLSREELAASNIHLLKPTQRNPRRNSSRRRRDHVCSGSILSDVHTLARRPAHSSPSPLMEWPSNNQSRENINPTTAWNLRSAFDQIMGRSKLAEMNLNSSFRGDEPVTLWFIL